MKKNIFALGAIVLALVACNKENKELPVNRETLLTFTSEKPQIETESKTAWDAVNSSIVWSSVTGFSRADSSGAAESSTVGG